MLAIVALALTKRMKVRAPFCETHRNHWTWRTRIIVGTFLGVVVLGMALGFVAASKALPEEMSTLMCISGGMIGFAWLVVTIVLQSTCVAAEEITDTHITLKRVSETFAEALQIQREDEPRQREYVESVSVRSSSSSGSTVLVLCLVGVMGFVVCLGAISLLGENAQKPVAPPPIPPVVFPAVLDIVEAGDHFRLSSPGRDWTLLPRKEIQKINGLASAGAENTKDDLLGMVLVEPADDDVRIAGNEEESARKLIEQTPLMNKKTESVKAVDFQGMKAVRFRFTATTQVSETELRYDYTVFLANGMFYQVVCLGPAESTTANGSSFQPFLNAFHLLPPDKATMKKKKP